VNNEFSPSLEFHLTLPKSKTFELIEGYLVIKQESNKAGVRLLATSGCRGYQYQNSWLVKGKGCIPPSKAIQPKQQWSVSTQRLWLPEVKGVEGSFYAIAPFQVSVLGVTRGDLGVHFDANVPGSAGCVVIRSQAHWDLFRLAMQQMRNAGYQQILLTVIYS